MGGWYRVENRLYLDNSAHPPWDVSQPTAIRQGDSNGSTPDEVCTYRCFLVRFACNVTGFVPCRRERVRLSSRALSRYTRSTLQRSIECWYFASTTYLASIRRGPSSHFWVILVQRVMQSLVMHLPPLAPPSLDVHTC